MATDLMTASTSYGALQKKYRNFGAPTIRLLVDGVEITEKLGAKITGVSVELTAEYSASGCGFDVMGEYVAQSTAFSSKGAAKLLQLGAKVELKLGYIETETVFYGLVAEVEYIMGNDEETYIHVECMDAKCLLMKRRRLSLFSDKSITGAVGGMFGEQPFSDYIKGKKVDELSEKLEMLPVSGEDDYQFSVRCARQIGYELFIVQGKLYFRKEPSSYSSIMTLAPNKGLLSVKQSLRGASLYKKAMVVGVNPADDKMISGQAALSGRFGEGAGASRMMSGSEKIYFDHSVESAKQAEDRAKVLLREAVGGFCRLECRCAGIPELVPGRGVTIEGISPQTDKEYYILNVRHTVDESGFFTNLEARRDTL